jgi:alpha-tubulin N-acetyltransferase 1
MGIGRGLFDAMLLHEATSAAKLAVDFPSPKMLAFLRKHFGLCQFVPQPNKFVVFDAFFAAMSGD